MSDRYRFENEREQAWEQAPLITDLSPAQERCLRLRLIHVLTSTLAIDKATSAIATDIIQALREPLDKP
jgi:hypothetical protein